MPAFEARGLAAFAYETARGATTLPYRKMPEEAHEDADELVRWSRLALGAARRVKDAKDRTKNRAGRSVTSKPKARPAEKSDV